MRTPKKSDYYIPSPESKAKRNRGWDKDHPTKSYRDIPDDFHNELVEIAAELQVSTGELLYTLAAYGLKTYKSGKLKIQTESKSRRMTILGLSTDQ
jgi:hypothetical protein